MVEIVKYYLVNVTLVASGSSLSLPKVLLCLKKIKTLLFEDSCNFFGSFFSSFVWNKVFTFCHLVEESTGMAYKVQQLGVLSGVGDKLLFQVLR